MTASGNGGPFVNGVRIDDIDRTTFLRSSTWQIFLSPNPTAEVIRISGDVLVDDVVVDTRPVPEPATASLLVAAGVFLLIIISRRK